MKYMNEKHVKDKIDSFLKEKDINVGRLQLNSKIKEVIIESITFVQLIVDLEMEFDIEFDDTKLVASEFESISDLISYVLKLSKGR